MQLTKSGKIHELCQPNALLTFKEYLLDYASAKTKKIGGQTIMNQFSLIKAGPIRKKLAEYLEKVEQGKRDLFF